MRTFLRSFANAISSSWNATYKFDGPNDMTFTSHQSLLTGPWGGYMKFDVIEPGLRHKYVPGHDDLQECVEMGKRIGEAVIEQTEAYSKCVHPNVAEIVNFQ